MGKKFNNIKPGTICTLIHNDSIVFRITHINESGFPFAMHSMYKDEFQIDEKPVCMAYTDLYKEATKEQKEKFIMEENYNVAECIKEVNIQNFKNALHTGIVDFKYRKKNGEIRDARGTLNIDIMGEENAPKGTGYNIIDTNICYYDLNSEGWRSFIADNLISWGKTNYVDFSEMYDAIVSSKYGDFFNNMYDVIDDLNKATWEDDECLSENVISELFKGFEKSSFVGCTLSNNGYMGQLETAFNMIFNNDSYDSYIYYINNSDNYKWEGNHCDGSICKCIDKNNKLMIIADMDPCRIYISE